MQYNVHVAKSRLSKLIEQALSGEEVIIFDGGKRMVRLVPIPQSGFKIGILDKKAGKVPEFFEPLPNDELDLWEGRGLFQF